jgi:murein DD-endopeptidase MepM/ murein hydrolase activator NlpD
MANEFYTLILVPHAKAKFRKIQVSVRLLKWGGITAAVLGVALVGILAHYTLISAQVYELRRLRAQNSDLLQKTRAYEQEAAQLQAKVHSLQKIVTKLGVMAGLEQSVPDPAVGGVGGVSSAESIAPSISSPSLRAMEDHLIDLTKRSERLEEFYRDQRVLLASTPSIWPVRGYLSTAFGNRVDPFTGQWDFHSGIDISTPIGTKIVAPADGIVVSAGQKGGYGNALTVDHGFGIVTQYGHLDSFNVRPGQRIHRGDVIGFVGNTGRSTGPHLHYEVWVHDQARNPQQYILDEYRSLG